jgi:HEAT repeat protein
MKCIKITVILFFFGMTVFAQDLSFFMEDFMREDTTPEDRLLILETVRDEGLTGIGEFYHNALKYLYVRLSDVKTKTEQDALEKSAVILSQGLGEEKYTDAAPELWQTVDYFDIARIANQGNAMQAALIALGQVNGIDYLPPIIQRLNQYNMQTFRDEAKSRVQIAVVGCISAIEAFKDISGYMPVFYVYTGSYDTDVKQIAYNALPNISDDPAEVTIILIQEPTNDPYVKFEAWKEFLRSKAPDSSKAKVAVTAIATSWSYATSNRSYISTLGEMRKSAIDIVRQCGAADSVVYEYLDRSFLNSFNTREPDYEEMILSLNALAALKSDEAVELLIKYLRELHSRRRTGPWEDKERRVFQWLISCIEFTGTKSTDARLLLNTIQRTADYTPFEQGLAKNALAKLN